MYRQLSVRDGGHFGACGISALSRLIRYVVEKLKEMRGLLSM